MNKCSCRCYSFQNVMRLSSFFSRCCIRWGPLKFISISNGLWFFIQFFFILPPCFLFLACEQWFQIYRGHPERHIYDIKWRAREREKSVRFILFMWFTTFVCLCIFPGDIFYVAIFSTKCAMGVKCWNCIALAKHKMKSSNKQTMYGRKTWDTTFTHVKWFCSQNLRKLNGIIDEEIHFCFIRWFVFLLQWKEKNKKMRKMKMKYHIDSRRKRKIYNECNMCTDNAQRNVMSECKEAKKGGEKRAKKRNLWKSICLYCQCIQWKMEFTNHLNEIMMTSERIYVSATESCIDEEITMTTEFLLWTYVYVCKI